MYCHNCGKNNPEGSKFCQHCGIKLTDKQADSETVSSRVERESKDIVDSETSPYPYVVSAWKLTILSVTTFGLYEIYWFYKHWRSLKVDRELKVTPWARALFSRILSYYLFKEVSQAIRSFDKSRRLEAGGLAIAYFILTSLWNLPEPYRWLSLLSFLPLIPVQNAINYYWDKKYGNRLVRSSFGTWNYIWVAIGIIIISLALYGTYNNSSTTTTGNYDYSRVNTTSTDDTYTRPSSAIDAFKVSYRDSFVQSCTKGASGLTQLCTCVANYMIKNYTDDELIKVTQQYKATSATPTELTTAMNACSEDLNAGSLQ